MKIIGIFAVLASILLLSPSVQAASDAEALQPVAPAEAVKVGDLGRYFDEYSTYMQLDTALHSSETMHLPDVHIGAQGLGGVTFFNGTIINETTHPETGADQPVTFGDKVRIDDYIYRNAPGASDDMPVLIGDGLSPALDDANALGESDRRWQYLYVSDNIYGADVIHEDNLSVTNNPTANQILSYAGDNNFTWINTIDALGSTSTRSDGSDAEDGDVIIGSDSDGDGDVDVFVAGDVDDLLSTLLCEDGEFIIYDSSSTPSWVCTGIADAVSEGLDGGDHIITDRIRVTRDGRDGTDGASGSATATTADVAVVEGKTSVPSCTAGYFATTVNLSAAAGFSAFESEDYNVTATYNIEGVPTLTPQAVYPIVINKTGVRTFDIYTCFEDITTVNWKITGVLAP